MLFGDVPQGSAIFVRGVRLAPGLNEKGQKAFEVSGSHTTISLKQNMEVFGLVAIGLHIEKALNSVVVPDFISNLGLCGSCHDCVFCR